MFFNSCHVVCSVLFVVCNLCLFTWLARVSSIRLNIQLANIWCLHMTLSFYPWKKDTNGTHGFFAHITLSEMYMFTCSHVYVWYVIIEIRVVCMVDV